MADEVVVVGVAAAAAHGVPVGGQDCSDMWVVAAHHCGPERVFLVLVVLVVVDKAASLARHRLRPVYKN